MIVVRCGKNVGDCGKNVVKCGIIYDKCGKVWKKMGSRGKCWCYVGDYGRMWCDMVKMWNIIDECGEIVGNVGSFVLKLMITSHSPSYIFVTCVTGSGVDVK